MTSLLLSYGFLQFPENKFSYIPATIEVILVIIGCYFVLKIIRKVAKKQEMQAKQLEQRALAERDERMKKQIKD